MTLLHPVRPENQDDLIALLQIIGRDIGGRRDNTYIRFADFPQIHFARWVVLPAHGDIPPQLVFGSDHDGDDDGLLRDLAAGALPALDAVYAHCDGWPGASDAERAVRYLRAGRVPYAARHVACRGRTVATLRQAVADRRRMQRYVDDVLQPPLSPAPPAPPDKEAARETVARIARETGPTLPPRRAPVNWQLPVIALAVLGGGGWALSRLPVAARWAVVGGLAGAVGAYLLALRAREKADEKRWQPTEPPSLEKLRELRDWEDELVQNQMTHLVPVKPGRLRQATLRTVLGIIDLAARYHYNRGDLGGIPTIHFARWVLIDGGRRLLFLSNYDGSWENYLGDFIDRASDGLTGIWSNTIDFPPTTLLFGRGSRQAEAFKNWTRRHQIETQVWYSAYPNVTVVNLLDALALCEGRAAAEAPSGDDAPAWLQRL